MALNAKTAGNNSGPRIQQANLEAGNYPVRIVQIIDFGLQAQRPFKGEDKPPAQEIGLTYEFLDEFMKDEAGEDQRDKPRWLSEQIPLHNLKADKAKSTQRYMALDPKLVHDGDFTMLHGYPAMLTVVNNQGKDGKVFDNVGALSPMRPRDAANAPELVNKGGVFLLDAPDMEIFNKFPKWIQEKITSNLQFKGSPLEAALKGKPVIAKEDAPDVGADDDAPFDGGKKVDDNNPY